MRRALASTIVVLGLVSAAPAAASFAGADGRVVFSSGRDLLTVLPDGSGLQPLTATPGVEEAQASWSPDGARVAFRVGTAGTSDVLQIAVMNADGSGRTALTGGDRHNSQPAWSPDGRQIVFRHSVPGDDLSGDIWIMGTDGSAPHPLVALPGDERYPSLSPDGARVAFTTHPTASDDVEIAVARADGTAVTAITDNAVFDSSPSWSPDSRRIAFERGPAGDDPGNDVWSMAADGTDQRQLTTSAGLDEGPSWSPDGSRIAFTSTRSGSSDIWTMAADGSDQQRLTALPGTEESPDWQPLPDGSSGAGTPPSSAAVPPAVAVRRSSRAPRLSLRLARGQSLRTLGRRGLVVALRCSVACSMDARLLRDRVTVGHARGRLRGAGTATMAIRLGPRTRARLAMVTRTKLTLRIDVRTKARRQDIRRSVTITRTGATMRAV